MNKQETIKWTKRIALCAVLGVTGLTALGAYNLYRMAKGLETLNLDDLKL